MSFYGHVIIRLAAVSISCKQTAQLMGSQLTRIAAGRRGVYRAFPLKPRLHHFDDLAGKAFYGPKEKTEITQRCQKATVKQLLFPSARNCTLHTCCTAKEEERHQESDSDKNQSEIISELPYDHVHQVVCIIHALGLYVVTTRALYNLQSVFNVFQFQLIKLNLVNY